MAWQLHYTSARSGPTGRAGFQFVAETPDLPAGVRGAVTPFMAYRPPPRAPLSPGAAELAGFPVALGYDRVAGRPLLVRCRYLGRDYSGRQGNFFAHAVVADPCELEGLRPVELWGAPLWAADPGHGPLPVLDELAPGAAFDPEALAEWLAESAPYDLLAGLLDAVAAVLGRGHGRVMIVADDAELIARWIAVVSYSLPVPAAARLTFLTYSADPDAAPQRIVGTTPDVWETTRHDGPVFFVDHAHRAAGNGHGSAPGRYARTAADCWRAADFTGLDAIGELAGTGPADDGPLDVLLDRAAALLALCRGQGGGEQVTAGEEAGVAALLTHGAEPPEWAWRDLAPALPGMGFDLAVAIMSWARRRDPELAERCAARCVVLALDDPGLRARLPEVDLPGPALARLAPVVADTLRAAPDLTEVARIAGLAERIGARLPRPEVEAAAAGCARRGAADLVAAAGEVSAELRAPLLAGALAGLEAADAATRAAVLTDAACDLVHKAAASPNSLPAVARHVLGSVGRRHRDLRLAVTRSLTELPAPKAEIDATLREAWAQPPPTAADCGALLDALGTALPRFSALKELPTRVFLRLAESGDGLEAGLALAARIRAVLPAAPDAAIVEAYAAAVRATEPAPAARRLDEIVAANGASERLVEAAFDGAARRLAPRTPVFRAALLAATREPARDRLVARWTAGRPGRSARHELVEVTLRLRGLGTRHRALEEWAQGQAAGRLAFARLDSHLRDHDDLRAALRELAARGGRQRRGG